MAKNYQESKREKWELDGVEIDIDEWPYLPAFLEIESDSEARVRGASEKLGFDYGQALFCNVTSLYMREYNIEAAVVNQETSRIAFNEPNPFK